MLLLRALLDLAFLLTRRTDLLLVGALDHLQVLKELLVLLRVEDLVLLVLNIVRIVYQRYLEWPLLRVALNLVDLLDRRTHECRLWVA